MKFIVLTELQSGKPILVNLDHLIDVYEDRDTVKFTTIQLRNGTSVITAVRNSFEDIVKDLERINGQTG